MFKRSFSRFALFASMLFLTPASIARTQTEELARGAIIEKVVCKADAGQSYALYLPSGYTPAKRWPIVHAFDPAARGRIPVERFKQAAEKYGYIVAGSNNSRNYSASGETSAAVMAMFNDTAARLSIDEKRIYTTGFSGGARVASNAALVFKGQIAGVIACGAGFPAGINLSGPLPFVFFGTIGIEDFNYIEFSKLDRTLDALGAAYRIEVFEGGHEWASSELCIRAIEWMELHAMKSGRRDRDEKLIDELFKKESDKARAHETSNMVYQAYIAYDRVARDFKGLKDVAEFENKAAQLKTSKEIKQAIKQEKERETEQMKRWTQLFNLRARLEGQRPIAGSDPNLAIDDAAERRLVIVDLKNAIADLKKKADAKESTPERAVARRSLNQYLAFGYEKSMMLLQDKKYDQAIASLSIDAETMPNNVQVLYRLACAYSLKGDKKRAIDALKKSVQKGFANAAEMERNKALDPLREEAEFKKIVEELGRKQS